MKRYTIKVVWPPFNRQPEETETADGEWVYAKEADAALSARDARIAELERHLAACKAECGAWRDAKDRGRLLWSRIPGGLISDSFTLASLQKIDELRAATDANGGVR